MSITHLEPLLVEAERRAVLSVLRSHPEWTLGYLAGVLDHAGARTPLLRRLTIGDLLGGARAVDALPPKAVNRARLELAQRLDGVAFDRCVQAVLAEARGQPVRASYLRARVGGPRWKLQGSLQRLVRGGVVEQCGRTSATRYRLREEAAGEG